MASAAPKRTRLSPEARREQLLDTAKEMIQQGGLQRFTMEALARGAAVSSPLGDNYVSSRSDLLRELLEREYQSFRREINAQLRSSENFEEIVRVFVAANFDHHSPGNILPVLLSQPELADSIQPREKKDNRRTAKFLIDSLAESYPLTRQQAELLISISSGASIAAAGYCARSKANRNQTMDAVVQYIFAGIRSFAET